MKRSCFALLVSSRNSGKGFSLIELMLVVAILAILGTVVAASYSRFVAKAEIQGVIQDMRQIEMGIATYKQFRGRLPDSLAQMGLDDMKDPWGNAYVYMPLSESSKKNKARKDRNLHPINTDYDLYSKGKDGQSTLPLTAEISQDDIIRANNGEFIGLASDY